MWIRGPLAVTTTIVGTWTSTGHLFRPRSDLNGAELSGPASLANLSLAGAHLAGAMLSKADLTGVVLSGADLSDARLRDANLSGAWLDEADLTNTRLSRTDLTHVGALSQEQVDAARGDRSTRLPTWITRPASWGRTESPHEE